jgi:hypothetical protein
LTLRKTTGAWRLETSRRSSSRVLARLGFDPSTFGGHSLRAGFVTSAVKRGANLIKITDVTGHRSLEMLKTYSRDAAACRTWSVSYPSCTR